MSLLLDTVTFLWQIGDSPRLSDTVRAAFRDATREIFLSAASSWEITVKHHLGKLPLPRRPEDFVPEMRERLSVQSLAIDEGSTLQVTKLPDLHRDPFDRILVCQAIQHGLTIATPDQRLRQYPVRCLW